MEGCGSEEPWMEFDCNGIVVAGLKMTLLIVTTNELKFFQMNAKLSEKILQDFPEKMFECVLFGKCL